MLPYVLGIAAIAVLALLVWLCHRIWREGYETATEFARTFPGRCMVCSYHQHGVDHGFVDAGELPVPHQCIEAPRG